MTFDEIFEKVRDIISEQLDITPDSVTLETNLQKDLEADSLDAVEIVMAIEDEFSIETPEDSMDQFLIVSNIVKFIEESL